MKKGKNYFHVFTPNDKLKMQNVFIFVDTETKTKQITKIKQKLSLRLGYAIFWHREKNIKEIFYYETPKQFWNWIMTKTKTYNNIILYAHNWDFDFKILNGYKTLFLKRDFQIDNFYVEGKTFILSCSKETEKKKIILNFWDTLNYIPSSLKQIGKSIKLLKGEINFDTCSKQELKEYCLNDTEILFKFIKLLITFLEENDLSKLRPTIASLSLNIFRHQFYDKKEKIYVHNWIKAISLEQDSYRGGISDCFKVGTFRKKIYKLDINSMYPHIMLKDLPSKLLFYSDSDFYSQETLFSILEEKDFLMIADINFELPEKYAYILLPALVNKQKKNIFMYGKLRSVLCSPEIDFVKKYGKITKVNRISVYRPRQIFKKFVKFFYSKRIEFRNKDNIAYSLFCKLLLNSLYGKFGQKNMLYKEIGTTKNFDVKSIVVLDGIEDKKYTQLQFGNKLFNITKTDKNSFDSFIAIPSFITSYSRMYLIKLILKAKRKNVYYCDTDSLFVNKEGYKLLSSYLGNKLGKLKLEGKSRMTIIYKSKYYVFNNEQKCKGIKYNATVKDETNTNVLFQQQQFQRFKTSLKKKGLDCQIITLIEKNISKIYDKGIVEKGIVKPYKNN